MHDPLPPASYQREGVPPLLKDLKVDIPHSLFVDADQSCTQEFLLIVHLKSLPPQGLNLDGCTFLMLNVATLLKAQETADPVSNFRDQLCHSGRLMAWCAILLQKNSLDK